MFLPNEILKRIVNENLAELFAADAFEVIINEYEFDNDGIPRMTMISLHVNRNNCKSLSEQLADKSGETISNIEVRLFPDKKTKGNVVAKVVSSSYYCEAIDDQFLDLVQCVKCIAQKIESLSEFTHIYHYNDKAAIVRFNEIGIDYPDRERRDLIVKRGNSCSIVRFGPIPETIPIEEDKVAEFIKMKINDGCTIDLSTTTAIMFADDFEYQHYIWDQEDDYDYDD